MTTFNVHNLTNKNILLGMLGELDRYKYPFLSKLYSPYLCQRYKLSENQGDIFLLLEEKMISKKFKNASHFISSVRISVTRLSISVFRAKNKNRDKLYEKPRKIVKKKNRAALEIAVDYSSINPRKAKKYYLLAFQNGEIDSSRLDKKLEIIEELILIEEELRIQNKYKESNFGYSEDIFTQEEFYLSEKILNPEEQLIDKYYRFSQENEFKKQLKFEQLLVDVLKKVRGELGSIEKKVFDELKSGKTKKRILKKLAITSNKFTDIKKEIKSKILLEVSSQKELKLFIYPISTP